MLWGVQIAEIGRRRLLNQRLIGSPLESAEAVVGWLGAVQSQEYAYAKWSVGQRAARASEAELDALIDTHRIVRTHILRPTWHFVLAADLRWMMALSGPRVDARTRPRYRALELDDATLARALDIIRAGLAGGRRLTRPQIGQLLDKQGIEVGPPYRREAILTHAELNLVVCSGGYDGRQPTYALVDEVITCAAPLSEDEALAELVRRYLTSHGPSTIADFTWWSGLRVADAKRGLAILGPDVQSFALDGTVYWMAEHEGSDDDAGADQAPVSLLQAFDELIVGYQRTRTVPLDPNSFAHPIVVDSEIVGRWRLVNRSTGITLDAQLADAADRRLEPAQRDALEAEIARCQEFYTTRQG